MKEFVNFLVFNSITAAEWESLKIDNSERVNELLDLFSNLVFEKIMVGIKYLEYRSEKELRAYQCLADKLVELSIKLDVKSKSSFLDSSFFTEFQNKNFEGKLLLAEKKYSMPRELELFQMTEKGCIISDGKLFKSLCLYLPQ